MSFDPKTKVWSGPRRQCLFNPYHGLGHLFIDVLERTPGRVTQISAETGVEVTCAELRSRSIRMAESLKRIGLGQKDFISIAAKNSEHLAPVVFGCLLNGIPVNSLDASFNKDDLAQMMVKVKPKMAFCDAENYPEVREALRSLQNPAEIVLVNRRLDEVKFVQDFFSSPVENEELYAPEVTFDPTSHPAVIICSSGTTGPSKGVMLSHSSLISRLSCRWKMREHETMLCFSSLYWASATLFICMGTLNSATRVITTEPFSPELCLNLFQKYRVTNYMAPPSHYAQLLNCPAIKRTDFSAMRIALCGGSPVPDVIRTEMKKYLPNNEFVVCYGMSEIGGSVTLTINEHRMGSVGQLLKMNHARIVDEEGNTLNNGEKGEVYLKTQFQFLGYLGNPEATKDILDEEGWIHSGDIGYFDDDGFLYIVDRKKDIMKCLRYQITPAEIESFIQGIEGVVAVAVVGIPDLQCTTLPAAMVVKRKDSKLVEKDIIDRVAARFSDVKRLRGGCYFVEQLPMTPSGKIQKRLALKIAIELYEKRQ